MHPSVAPRRRFVAITFIAVGICIGAALTLAATLAVLVFTEPREPIVLAATPATELIATPTSSKNPMKALAGYAWSVDESWNGDSKPWTRNEFQIVLDGAFVESRTFVETEDGRLEPRFITLYRWEPNAERLTAHGFADDGATSVLDLELSRSESGRVILTTYWTIETESDLIELKQEMELLAPDRYAWRLWSAPLGSEDWQPLIDTICHRGEPL
ncbi:MAG: hypothetical protein AAFR38_13480 [Planctomycetota bacterium]